MGSGYRHADPRFPFLWSGSAQAAARWHGDGEGPAHYFADTPSGAWAEFLRHEGITEAVDLAGIHRSLWWVEWPDHGTCATPDLPDDVLFGDGSSYPACQAVARRLRAEGHDRLQVRGAALLPGEARGWLPGVGHPRDPASRDGLVHVVFGAIAAVGWAVVESGRPPATLLPLVRHLSSMPTA